VHLMLCLLWCSSLGAAPTDTRKVQAANICSLKMNADCQAPLCSDRAYPLAAAFQACKSDAWLHLLAL
jgi:hypothetical protein